MAAAIVLGLLGTAPAIADDGPPWARALGGPDRDRALAIAVGGAGEVYVLGHFRGQTSFGPDLPTLLSTGDTDVFLVKLDPGGQPVWARRFGGSGQDEGRALAADSEGGVYLTGFFSGEADYGSGGSEAGGPRLRSTGASDAFVLRVDAAGGVRWARGFGGPLGDVGLGLDAAPEGGVAVTGYFQSSADLDPGAGRVELSSAGGTDAFVARLDAAGELIWARSAGGPRSDEGRAVALGPGGTVTVAGLFEGSASFGGSETPQVLTSAGASDAALWRLDATGGLMWARGYGGPGPDVARGVAVGPAGEVYAAGTVSGGASFGVSRLEGAGGLDAFLLRVDPQGELAWLRSIASAGSDLAFGVAASGGEVAVAGFTLLSSDEASFSGESVAFLETFDPGGERRERRETRSEGAVQLLGAAFGARSGPCGVGLFESDAKLTVGDEAVRLEGRGKQDVFVACF